jgi:predicted AlkP superfamily phosphohydrolase/phosphomutase
MSHSMTKRLIIIVVAVVLTAAILLYATGCDRSGNTSGTSASTGRVFDTWADYLASDLGENASKRKVVFIGIDGACWNIIDPLIDEGLLPTFARLKAEGTHGILRSVECYVSPPAWVSMMTGYLPEHTGVFTFGDWDAERREFVNITSQDVKVPSLWDVTSFVGRRTAVVNVPVTYPVRDVAGIMVSGLLTPSSLAERQIRPMTFRPLQDTERKGPASFSPVLHASFDHTATRMTVFLRDTSNDGEIRYDTALLAIGDVTGGGTAQTEATVELPIGQYSDWLPIRYKAEGTVKDAWCKVLVFATDEPDVFLVVTSRVYFDAGDTEVVFAYPESLQGTLEDEFGHYFPSQFLDGAIVPGAAEEHVQYASFLNDYDDWDAFFYVFTQTDNIQHIEGVSQTTKWVYQIIDRYLDDLVSRLPKDAVVILASDHGFTQYTYSVDLNKMFERMGLLTYRDDTEIDHDRTLVFHNLWSIYFNDALLTLEELDKRGIETLPGRSAQQALAAYLERAKPSFRIPAGNQLITVELFPTPDSDGVDAPDMIVKGTYSNYIVEFWNLARPHGTIIRTLGPDENWNHTREGMYLFYGNGVKRGFNASVEDIQDIAPTILFLLDLPLADDMDGRVIRSVFDSRRLARRSFPTVRAYNQIYAAATTDEEREALEEKLRSLGYIR